MEQSPSSGGMEQSPSSGGMEQSPSSGGMEQSPSSGGMEQPEKLLYQVRDLLRLKHRAASRGIIPFAPNNPMWTGSSATSYSTTSVTR